APAVALARTARMELVVVSHGGDLPVHVRGVCLFWAAEEGFRGCGVRRTLPPSRLRGEGLGRKIPPLPLRGTRGVLALTLYSSPMIWASVIASIVARSIAYGNASGEAVALSMKSSGRYAASTWKYGAARPSAFSVQTGRASPRCCNCWRAHL